MSEMTYVEALCDGLKLAMRADERVIIFGEDLTTWGTGGGPFGATAGIAQEFGPSRIRNTPISEEAIVAAGVGAAIAGMRPVVEIMYSDFMLLTLDPIVNQAAKIRYMFGGQFDVPLVVRSNGGATLGKAGQHSSSLETLFAHIPGLEVVVPATASDVRQLIQSAIKTPNPTIFLEHKALYNITGLISDEPIPLGRAGIARAGRDVTIVATQLMVHRSLAAAQALLEDGIEIEVIDLRTLYPLDLETVLASVRRTKRAIVAHEAPLLYGFGAELAASIGQYCWAQLEAPVLRVGGARTPIPFAEVLESAVVPSVEDVVSAVKRSLGTTSRCAPV